MLISHRYKFIFLKTEKTASSSIFNALRGLLRETDELLPADRKVRARLLREHGSLAGFSFESGTSAVRRKTPWLLGIHRHGKARDVRDFIGTELFSAYTVVTSERNPWDRQVSLYAHRNGKRDRLHLSHFDRDMRSWRYNALHYNHLDNWGIYTIGDRVAADVVIRYEHLADDFAAFLKTVGLPADRVALPTSRSGKRPSEDDYRAHYTPATEALIAGWYRKEIDHFGYRFDSDI